MSSTPFSTVPPPAPKRSNSMVIGIVVALLLCVCIALVLGAAGVYWLSQSDVLASATSTPTAVVRPPGVTPSPARPTSGVISGITLATDTRGDNKDPVNPTTVFTPRSVFHAVVAIKDAPRNTKFTAAWYVTDVGSAASPNSLIDSTDLTSEGTRNLDFTLTPTAQWPAGKYRVEISVNNVLDRTVDFTVSGSSSTAPTPAVKPSGFITGITMALDSKGENKDPVNPTTTFSPTAVFHAIVGVKNAPARTVFKATWYAEDVGSAAAPNSEIDTTDLTTDGTRNVDFTLTPTNRWPVGTYRVEISVNGVLDSIVKFSVK
ncbi:MAG: hypothetical protein HY782_02865 [Chloroflexi bacterium]|nr:hypothetical protein [Chloroflexota bacterium]